MAGLVGACKRWTLTLNNYTDIDFENLKSLVVSNCTYGIIGKEVGAQGTPHLQGFTVFAERKRFDQVKELFGSKVHLEAAYASVRQNRFYCSKDGKHWEFGKPQFQGRSCSKQRSNKDNVASDFVSLAAKGRKGLTEFFALHQTEALYHGKRLFENYILFKPTIDRPDIHVEWIYGDTGTGKSKYAHSKYPEAYVKDSKTKWWNGYFFETDVIIDDLGPQCIDIIHLLHWFDRYRSYCEYKGGQMPLYAYRFCVTSNFHPRDIYGDHPQYDALLRRISLLKY